MRVVRAGQESSISTYDLLVGDVVMVDTGDILAADGLLYKGNDLRHVRLLFCETLAGLPVCPAHCNVAMSASSRGWCHTSSSKQGVLTPACLPCHLLPTTAQSA